MNRDLSKATKLTIWDFDGTLIDSPLPDVGRKEYEKKTGEVWSHQGWWGRPESLDSTIFDMPEIQGVISDFKREKANPHAITIMLTGRMRKLGHLVKKILDDKELFFDEYCYNEGGSTDEAKIKTLNSLLHKYPSVDSLEMWEDRAEHIKIFEQWGKVQCLSGRLKNFNINFVISNHHQPKNND